MAPFYRRRYYYRNWWNSRRRRNTFRRRRFGKPFRTRKRRRRRVRRHFYTKKTKKLKKLKLYQWQPHSIKKCRIEGYLCAFQAGYGRYSYNYALSKETIFPPHTPGGGGWSIQQLTLGNLYQQHKELMNYWTKSNERMNLCRYLGCKITMFREKFVDWVFTFYQDQPKNVSKYFYNSHHPIRLLTHKRKIIIPSFETQPHKRKPYKSMFIPPPRIFKNQWFFQQQFTDYPLLTFAAAGISLTNMWGSNTAKNNNAEFYCLDTSIFTTPLFQYRTATHPQWGYRIAGDKYLWGLTNGKEQFTQNQIKDAIYLGNTMLRQRGAVFNTYGPQLTTKYPMSEWGNPFYWTYLTKHVRIFQTTNSPDTYKNTPTKTLEASWEKQVPLVFKIRYNPFKDKGIGNKLYVIPNYSQAQTTWKPTTDPDLTFENFPLWIMCWGLLDILKRMGKTPNLEQDYIVVINSKYLSQPEQYYVPLSYDFVHGRGPYDADEEDMSRDDYTHWFPRIKYQKQALENIAMTGPAVPTGDNVKNIQATIKYNFFFKWGGNSSPQESIYDPTTQPVTPSPNNLLFQNEIIDPSTSFINEIYEGDFRRHMLTETAAERIKQSDPNEYTLFTDGRQTSTDVQLFPQETQTEETPKTQAETLLQQLNLLQQYNSLLQQRFRKLKLLSQDL
nr:MAG: ORF1 [TTV-like mini virus]